METYVVELPAELSIADVNEWKPKLEAALASSLEIEINGSRITRIDTAFLQLLATFFNHANLDNRRLFWRDPSQVLTRSAGQLALADILNLVSS